MNSLQSTNEASSLHSMHAALLSLNAALLPQRLFAMLIRSTVEVHQ